MFVKEVEATFRRLRQPTIADGGGAVLESVDDESGTIVIRLVGACLDCPAIKLSAVNFIEGFLAANIRQIHHVKVLAGGFVIADWSVRQGLRTTVLSDVVANSPSILRYEQPSCSKFVSPNYHEKEK